MKKVTMEQVKDAMKLIREWAIQNNVDYAQVCYMEEFGNISLTYSTKEDKENYNYLKVD